MQTSELAKVTENESVNWGYTERMDRGNNFTLIKCNSKMILKYGYAPILNRLFVMFRPRKDIYVYFDVPQTLFEEMNKADSKGKFLNSEVKKKFRYEKRIDLSSL